MFFLLKNVKVIKTVNKTKKESILKMKIMLEKSIKAWKHKVQFLEDFLFSSYLLVFGRMTDMNIIIIFLQSSEWSREKKSEFNNQINCMENFFQLK